MKITDADIALARDEAIASGMSQSKFLDMCNSETLRVIANNLDDILEELKKANALTEAKATELTKQQKEELAKAWLGQAD